MERKFAVETPGTKIKHAHYFESPANVPTPAERKGFEAKCYRLSGEWERVIDEATLSFAPDAFVLDWQNGFFAVTKVSKLNVFVVTTGERKGIWHRVASSR